MQKISQTYQKLLEKQSYEIVGDTAAVKICSWTKKSIRDQGNCYKQLFYGIRSHKCCQLSTTVGICPNLCVFCWRDLDQTLGNDLKNKKRSAKEIIQLIEKVIIAQKKLLIGFKGNEKANQKKLQEAFTPKHFAISLTGEPTADKDLPRIIKKLHSLGNSTFVVSNGLYPERLKLVNPTQLYLSVDAPDEKTFLKVDRPKIKNAWEKFQESLKIIKNKRCRTALRITLIKGLNMHDPEGFARIIKQSNPMFVEAKAYMFVGSSIDRLNIKMMPRHPEVKEFSEIIAKLSNYKIIDEQESSRVVLLMKKDRKDRIMKF